MAALSPPASLRGADAVRILAALAVVVFHYRTVRTPGDPAVAWLHARPWLDAIAAHGYLGVDVFFALSGFLLVMPWARRAFQGAPAPRIAMFWQRRLRRIVPAYYVHLVFLFAIAMPLLLGAHYAMDHPGLVAYNVAAHALFLQYTTPLSAGSFGLNGALWTLTLEMEFYLLLPWLAPRFVQRPLLGLAGGIALAFAWRTLAGHGFAPLVEWQMALGARWSIPETAVRDLIAGQLPGYAAHFACGMALGTFWVHGNLQRREPLRRHEALRLAALASYAVYLWHLPLLLLWNRARVLEGSVLSFPAYCFLVAVVAALSHALVERPFLRREDGGRTPIIER